MPQDTDTGIISTRMLKYIEHTRLSLKLLAVVALLIVLLTGSFLIFQFSRERQYRIDILDTRLQGINEDIARLAEKRDTAGLLDLIQGYGGRVTILDMSGNVLYDSMMEDISGIGGHAGREEIAEAVKSGRGYSLKRASETVGGKWFYSATSFPGTGIIVRSAHIYDVSMSEILASDKGYVWTALILSGLLFLLFYRYVRHIDLNIKQLKTFASMAAQGREINDADMVFTDDELGEISARVVELYAMLQNSEDDKTRLKRQLTQNVAHELKTPVSIINGYLETILYNEELDGKSRQAFLERCHAQVGRLGSLVNDITLLSKMDDAAGTFMTETIDIRELVGEIAGEVSENLEAKKMRMLVLIGPDTVIKGSRKLVYSIFRNLTDNAIAYAGEGTTITVQCRRSDSGHHHFIFNDNGEGVPEEHLVHLFERFYRVDKGRSRTLGGTGLGLAIVKNAVLLHGGRITARNGESGGLEFAFSLARSKELN